MIMHKPALFLLSLVITVLLMALTLGVAAASSHVISDQYIDVEPDGYWTAEVAAGGHQQWNFDLVEQRNHNTVIEIVEPADASLDVSIDGQHLGTVSVTGHFTVSLEAGSHAVTIDNPGDVPVQYEFYMGNGFDFGDAPDSYSTLLGSGGPSHVLGSSVFMGPSVDPEPDGQPSVLADGDDLDTFFTSSGDDEDGVAVISPLTPGFLALMAVVGSPSGGKLDAWARRAGMKGITLHSLRHSHASVMLQEGVSSRTVADRLGHSNVVITLGTYSHLPPGVKEEAAMKFEEALHNAKTLAAETAR